MIRSKSSSIRRQRRRMCRFQNIMFRLIDEFLFGLCKISSKQKHKSTPLLWKFCYHGISKLFSSNLAMRSSFRRSDREYRIEQEYSLSRSTCQISWLSDIISGIFESELFVDIAKTWRQFDILRNWKCQSLSLTFAMIGILSNNHDLRFVKCCEIKRFENIVVLWIDNMYLLFFWLQKIIDLTKIILVKFVVQERASWGWELWFDE